MKRRRGCASELDAFFVATRPSRRPKKTYHHRDDGSADKCKEPLEAGVLE